MIKSKASVLGSQLVLAIKKRLLEATLIGMVALAFMILISLMTYASEDIAVLKNPGNHAALIQNAAGTLGAYLAFGFYWFFGFTAYLLPLGLMVIGAFIFKEHQLLTDPHRSLLILRVLGLMSLVISSCALFSLTVDGIYLPGNHGPGGVLGEFFAIQMHRILNIEGEFLVLIALDLIGVNWLTGLSWISVIEGLGGVTLEFFQLLSQFKPVILKSLGRIKLYFARWSLKDLPLKVKAKPFRMKKSSIRPVQQKPTIFPNSNTQESLMKQQLIKLAKESEDLSLVSSKVSSLLPHLSLLDKALNKRPVSGYSSQELESLSRMVEQHLIDFGIQADVVAVHPGPVITRFELQLAAGVKVSRLTALVKDLARSLSVTSVRIVEIIPGKTVVGIELPNQDRTMVGLEEVLVSEVYQQAVSPLTLALGVDIAGHPMIVDLAKMPHLLVAGTTGSGKSVGINAMILSLLFKSSPEQVRLIMIDPKMLELSVYDGIPHLLTPVVTDMKEAAAALRWCVAEMERRYRLMASLGVRNLAGFNQKVSDAAAEGRPIVDPFAADSTDENPKYLFKLPYVVVVIDELADMMMVVGKKVEQLIARIAQKARASGIHLILATQRPSVDVLTGLIKSNIPTRISFQVSSKIDSRTILDQQGAEQLLGHGDMLFLAPGTGAPLRVHGAFVSDKEVHRVANHCRSYGEPQYIEEITQEKSDSFEGGFHEDQGSSQEDDPLYDQAVEFVTQTRKASISAVQRRFRIGYNRAARLVEEMERSGLVGPLEGGLRELLVSPLEED